jgi:hypothetical protein
MVGPAPWRNHNHVYLHIFTLFAIFWEQNFCRSRHAAQPCGINCGGEVNCFRPGLYLNKGYAFAAPRDQVNFAPRGLYACANDAPTFQTQEPRRNRFAASSAFFGGKTVHEAFNSEARA